VLIANGDLATSSSVTKPCLTAGPNGEILICYEKDIDVDRLLIEGRHLRSR
jgi:hypothetical protein